VIVTLMKRKIVLCWHREISKVWEIRLYKNGKLVCIAKFVILLFPIILNENGEFHIFEHVVNIVDFNSRATKKQSSVLTSITTNKLSLLLLNRCYNPQTQSELIF